MQKILKQIIKRLSQKEGWLKYGTLKHCVETVIVLNQTNLIAMSRTTDNYFLNYHELVLSRLTSGRTKLYPHQVQALLAIYQKASKGEMDGSYRQAALILAGVGTGKTLIQAIAPYILASWMQGRQALFSNSHFDEKLFKLWKCRYCNDIWEIQESQNRWKNGGCLTQ